MSENPLRGDVWQTMKLLKSPSALVVGSSFTSGMWVGCVPADSLLIAKINRMCVGRHTSRPEGASLLEVKMSPELGELATTRLIVS